VGPTTQVLALVYLIGIWAFVPSTRLVTELRYRTIAIPSMAAQVANTVVSIVLAFAGLGVWALVWGTVAYTIISTVFFWVLRPWRFRLSFRRRVAVPLLKYAQHMISAAVLAFLIINIDDFMVGWKLGTTQLGFYAVAAAYGFLPVSLFSGPAGQAFFPSLTKIQGDPDLLRQGFLEGFGYAMAIIAPSAIGMAVLSPEIVNILFGPGWSDVTVPLLILSFYGLFRAIVDFSTSLFGAIGKPRIFAELNLYILLLSLIPLYPFTIWWGIRGTALSMTIPVVLVAVVAIRKGAEVLGGKMSDFYDRIRGPMIATEVMGVTLFFLRLALEQLLPSRVPFPFSGAGVSEVTIVLVAGVSAGIAVYFWLLRSVDRKTYLGLRRTIAMVMPVRSH
jgi:PST family polysaccharide transporter